MHDRAGGACGNSNCSFARVKTAVLDWVRYLFDEAPIVGAGGTAILGVMEINLMPTLRVT